MYKLDGQNDSKDTAIFNRAKYQRLKTTYTLPGTSGFLGDRSFRVMHRVPSGIKEIATLSAVTEAEIAAEEDNVPDLSNLEALLTPPNETYSDIIPPEGVALAQQVEGLATKQMIQQFYETYMAPLGMKDVYNRLGAIAGNIADMHLLYPNGLKGVIAADARASWRTNINFSFTVKTGLRNSSGSEISEKYDSLAFPPYIQHETFNANDLLQSFSTGDQTAEENVVDESFDMDNLLYKRNAATFRFPAFKQVNDNIHVLQVLLNRCFGVESTFMNEWDLSLYMQEGLTSFTEKEDLNGDIIRIPQFVTTLTYGLLDDAPTEVLQERGKKTGYTDVDLDTVTPFASVNMAVSTRFGVDNQPIGQKANESIYIVSDYPYSAFWYPWDSGVRMTELNVSDYIDKFFSFRVNGLAYADDKPENIRTYTPAVYHGAELSKSTKTFRQILNYTDDRNAILSGWNATNENGIGYLRDSDNTNEATRSNTYSYLPFWKQFYTNGEDGMSDVDLYIQEITAADKEVSFINAAYQIINLTTGSNDTFNDVCEKYAKDDYEAKYGKLGEDEAFNMVVPSKFGDASSNYKDMSFSLFKCKLKIPGSKLLNMFLNKSSSTSKAMAASKQSLDFNNDDANASGGVSASPSAALKNAQPTKTLGEPKTIIVDGKEVEVTEYAPEDNDELCSKKVNGDGIAEWSPFIYGGPHGKYFSPLTLEGYTQVGNQTLANVPTVDTYAMFNGIRSDSGIRGLEFSKNWKNAGSYIDHTIALTPNEKEALTQGSTEFGVKGMKPDTRHIMPYTSNWYVREYFHDWSKYIKIRIFRHTIRIPHFWYFKIMRTQNGGLHHWIAFTKDYGTGYYSTRSHTTRLEYNVSVQTDWWSQQFRLLPTCGWEGSKWSNNNNYNTGYTWDLNTTLQHIDHDAARFRQPSSWTSDADGNISWIWKPGEQHIGADCVKWLIVPTNVSGGPQCGVLDPEESSDRRWLHWSSYSVPGSTWYNQLKNLWWAGTREMSVTLPILDNRGNIIELIAGVANLHRGKAMQWGWRLKTFWFFWFRHGWGCPHPMRWAWRRWVYTRVFVDTYSLYFRPQKVQWILPTDKLLNREAHYTSQRDKNSANIIERWCTDGANDMHSGRFSHLSQGANYPYSPDLFPFTREFIQKYGYYEPYTMLPGVSASQHTRYVGSFRVLHTKGMYWGDIMESYRKEGTVQSTVAVRPLWQQWNGDIYYTDTAAGVRYSSGFFGTLFRTFFGRVYEQSSRFTVRRNVLWTADYPIWVEAARATQWELTNIINNCQAWPVIQDYQIDRTPYMTWYKPLDAISVFIETAIQQIAWLEQLRDYAQSFLKDQLIYDVYEKSVDNRVKAVIEYNYNGDSKSGKNYKNAADGWTESFTEDINYHDALAIVRRVFKTDDPEKNTIYDLTVARIAKIKGLQKYAESIRANFNSNPTYYMHLFMRLVTNTKSYLDGAMTGSTTAEAALFNADGTYNDMLYEINGATTYNMLTNPAAVLWAYINVLYHVRKYWINMRFNKRAGSYWFLRGLERVLTFMLAANTAEDSPTSPEKHIEQGDPLELRTKAIQYVQPRTSFDEQSKKLDDFNQVMTHAVYVAVDYLALPDPKTGSKWNENSELYDGKEIVYVPEVYKWAFKPTNGLYYVMSNSVSSSITSAIEALKDTVTAIYSKEYVVTTDDFNQVCLDYSADKKEKLGKLILTGQALSESEDAAKTNTTESVTELLNTITDFENDLIGYKREYYMSEIRNYLYPVYIKWDPAHVWTGLREDDEKGDWHIDEWQYKDTFGKERTVRDLYGYEHTSTEAISAGITFDVVLALNPETLLNSPAGLRDSSILEILCSCTTKTDLWRIEIPSSLNIPVNVLEDKPVLVPAYQIDAAANGLKAKEATPTKKSVLCGSVSSSVVPIVETQESMLTINSLSALGSFNQVAATDLGIPEKS